MRGTPSATREPHDESVERGLVWREGTTMVLYVAVVLFAALAALPGGHDAGEAVSGPVGRELIAIVWGTTIGVAMAHWFAFRVATQGFGGGTRRGQASQEAMAQLVGAALVAAMASVPVLLFGEVTERRAVLFVLAAILGGVGYLVGRVHGRTRASSAAFAAITLLTALVVVTFKILLSEH